MLGSAVRRISSRNSAIGAEEPYMERRNLVVALGVATTVAVTGRVAAQGVGASSMHPPKYKALEEANSRCVITGNDCLRHCFGMLGMGDVSMSSCTASTYEVVAACSALLTLAAMNSAQTPAFAKVVGEMCISCQRECEKFPEIAECKACGDACRTCAEECRKASA